MVFQRQQKLLNIMPPFIAYGYACGIHLPLSLGITVVIVPNLDPAELGKLVLKYKPAHMFGVPAHYQVLAADPHMKKKDLSFVLNFCCGGDAISLGAEKTVNDFLSSHGARYALAKGLWHDRGLLGRHRRRRYPQQARQRGPAFARHHGLHL